ncbi:MAG TPA: TadE/TadG family type IV pilus assembly protein [Caulobacteraceae bacterium]|nr:TadE/TadG family type IV pilus assembly protein [Caulobacteraceae bacterium]
MFKRALLADEGVAAVEFAFMAPIFCLLMVAAIDLGGALFTKFRLDAAVSAGANFAQVQAANASSTAGQTLANNIATIVEASQGAGWANTTVVVDNGPTTTVTGGTQTTSGTASNADACYCPSGSASSMTWGASTTCGNSCGSNAGYAGKFVTITATRTYTPIFSNYGIISNDAITTSTVVQVQ